MKEQLRETYFLAIRISLLFILVFYIVLTQSVLTGASAKVLLLLALFVSVMAGKELVSKMLKGIFFVLAVVLCLVMIVVLGKEFVLLAAFLAYEIISYLWSILCQKKEINPSIYPYVIPVLMAFIPSEIGVYVQLTVVMLMGIVFLQHDFVVESYKRQMQEDLLLEQHLKRNMHEKEHEMQEEMNKGLLKAQNQLLEERARLSQTLHDKLGHNINGSVYQLEAAKVLMDKEPEKSKKMLQAVIEELRGGMDEIRAILRKERPDKYKLAILQLEKLCEECNKKGVAATLHTEGNMSEVPEKYLEIILDNAFEAVSNSMKYAKCSEITIKIHVMNKLIRCSISDNGIGCSKVVDGMGISGMRRRIREINGILDFETEMGFTINMLLPR